MKKQRQLSNFTAPPEMEIKIIDFCVETLNLSIGDFWYKWFDSNKEGNHTIHIDTSNPSLEETLQKTFLKLDFVDSVFKIQKCDVIGDVDEFLFQYFIHFKAK